jgi:hypothetical protein
MTNIDNNQTHSPIKGTENKQCTLQLFDTGTTLPTEPLAPKQFTKVGLTPTEHPTPAPDTGIGIEDILNETEQLEQQCNEVDENIGLLTVKPVNQWIKEASTCPIPEMLLGEFWYEGELCFLFADTNTGKSIAAVQIGNAISRGEQIPGFPMEPKNRAVLYFDFELSSKQFENRYSIDYQQPYKFSDAFHRAEINPDAEIPKDYTCFEDYLNISIEESIIQTGAKVLIIDNLTYLNAENERAKDALPLMKKLKTLKSKYGLSILALAHTPKRDLSKPITRNDLAGSKMLINFCDSAFTIGESSQDKSMRYLKQIKVRQTESRYDSQNVMVCIIEKPFNFLQFRFLNFGTELEHLKQISETGKSELENSIIDLLKSEPGITSYAIAKKLCKNERDFNSFKVKVTRIVNRGGNSSNI